MARFKHYVNLQKKALFVERDIDSLDRLSIGVHYKAKFKKPDAMPVSFRVVKISEVSPYTEAEKKRSMWYELQEPIGLEVNEGDEMEATTIALLPPSGGAVYKIEARAGDKTVATSDEVETWRRLFFQTFYMNDPADSKKQVKVPNLKDTIDYYKTLFLELLDVPQGVQTDIAYQENATSSDLINLVKPKYSVKNREPWVLALVFANALPGFSEITIGVDTKGAVDLPSRWSGNEQLVFDLPEGKFAWWGMNPTHDAKDGGNGIWLRGDGKLTVDGQDVVVPKASITLDKSHTYRAGKGFGRLKIALPEAARNTNLIFDKGAKLTVTLWVVDGFAGGFAMVDENLLTVSRVAWWQNKEDGESEKLQVLNHELGHKLGMVPKGGKRFGGPHELDAPDKLYGDEDLVYAGNSPSEALKDELRKTNNSKGHRGAHCERGVKAKKKDEQWVWKGKPECTMFGATATDSARAPQKFCSVCEKLVIRQNMDPASSDAVLRFKSQF